MGHPFSKFNPVNSRVSEPVFQKCGKQEELSVATLGRIKKIDIEKSIGKRISDQTILCSDSHVSYKGFAIDNEMEHHAIRADLKQYVKDRVYHIQHIHYIIN